MRKKKGECLTREQLAEGVRWIKAHPIPDFDGIILGGELAGRLVKKVKGKWVLVED